MNEIYSKSHQTVISLGQPTAASNDGMDFLYMLRNAIVSPDKGGPGLLKFDAIMHAGGFKYTSPSWGALSILLRRPWFSRIWVVQEVTLGRNPVFICGNRGIPWDILLLVCTTMDACGEFHSAMERKIGAHEFAHDPGLSAARIKRMGIARSLKQSRRSAMLSKMLLSMYIFDSTDPRDKIFALLGIATDAEHSMLDPNYNASVEVTYLKTAAYLLIHDNCICLLHAAGVGLQRRYKNLPSWVPQLMFSHKEDNLIVLGSRVGSGYRAAGSTISSLYFRDRRTLAVDGILIDTVGNVSSKCPINSVRQEDAWVSVTKSINWFRELDIMVDSLRPNGGDLSVLYTNNRYTWEEAYWRTLAADNSVSRSATAYYRDCSKWVRRAEDAVIAAGGVEAQCAFKEEITQNEERFGEKFGGIMKSRSFFTTYHGYVGLGSSCMLPGDKVCIFLGGITPFIIREKTSVSAEHGSSIWTLVGEAYVHGLMDGEGLEMGVPEEILLV